MTLVHTMKHVHVSRMNAENYLFIFPDCLVLGCRLVLIMEDLLWVLTDDQLKAAFKNMNESRVQLIIRQ